MTTAPIIDRRDDCETRLEWPDLVVLVFDHPDGLEVGQFASAEPMTRPEVEERVLRTFTGCSFNQ